MSRKVHSGFIQISPKMRSALEKANVTGCHLRFPEKLEGKAYRQIARILEQIGGQWSQVEQAIVFEGDPNAKIQRLLNEGYIASRNKKAFFFTPQTIVNRILENIPHLGYRRTLEPHAGLGHMARSIKKEIECALQEYRGSLAVCEINDDRRSQLISEGFDVIEHDFLKLNKTYNCILMNPPYSLPGHNEAWLEHVLHGWNLLEDGGDLIAVVPNNLFSNSKRALEFQKILFEHGSSFGNAADSFKSQGVEIQTVTVHLERGHRWQNDAYQGYSNWFCWYIAHSITNDGKSSAALARFALQVEAIEINSSFNACAKSMIELLCRGLSEQRSLKLTPYWSHPHRELYALNCGGDDQLYYAPSERDVEEIIQTLARHYGVPPTTNPANLETPRANRQDNLFSF